MSVVGGAGAMFGGLGLVPELQLVPKSTLGQHTGP